MKSKAAPFHKPEHHHDEKGEAERPEARMDQEEKSGGESAGIDHKKTNRLARISPMSIDIGHSVCGKRK